MMETGEALDLRFPWKISSASYSLLMEQKPINLSLKVAHPSICRRWSFSFRPNTQSKRSLFGRILAYGSSESGRRRLERTWDATMSMIPKGGDTIWGGLDWSPEEDYVCMKKQKNNDSYAYHEVNSGKLDQSHTVNYGRLISFGKDVAEMPSSKIERIDFRVFPVLR